MLVGVGEREMFGVWGLGVSGFRDEGLGFRAIS